jgi:hypothetical protein
MRVRIIIVIVGIMLMGYFLSGEDKMMISVFYKEKKPSKQVLEKINPLLEEFKNAYQVTYYLIEDQDNADLISEFGLPSTHFPVAVVINGKFTAKVDSQVVSFVHFPLFMKGIGRHEGNWSIADLKKVLNDYSLLLEENILPALEEESSSDCED